VKLPPWAPFAGGALAWGALVLFFSQRDASEAVARVVGWHLMGSPTTLRKGRRYRGCVKIPIFSPSTSTVRAKAEAAGFSNVVVTESRPKGWPDVACEYFVEGTWASVDRSLEVPGVVKLAWEES
jgi:hypothetical protein